MEDYKYFQLLLTRCNGFCCHMVLAEFRRRDHREGEIMGARMAAGQPSHLRSTMYVCIASGTDIGYKELPVNGWSALIL